MMRTLLCRLLHHEWITFDILTADRQHYVKQISVCYRCRARIEIPA